MIPGIAKHRAMRKLLQAPMAEHHAQNDDNKRQARYTDNCGSQQLGLKTKVRIEACCFTISTITSI